jgi:preprotein translocase subunit SecF
MESIINRSLNETLSRTILTAGTVLIVVLSLFFFGGEIIHDFAFTMLVGVLIGTYSSIYISCPILLYWPYKGKK